MSTININKATQRILLMSQRWSSGSRDASLVCADRHRSAVIHMILMAPSLAAKEVMRFIDCGGLSTMLEELCNIPNVGS